MRQNDLYIPYIFPIHSLYIDSYIDPYIFPVYSLLPLPCLVPHVALEDLWARPKDLQAPGELKVHQAVLKALAVPGGPIRP